MSPALRTLVFAVAAALWAAASRAQPTDIAATLDTVRAEAGVPAVGALALRGGRVEVFGVAGVLERGEEAPVGLGDAWHIGSCGKAMTATVLARLVDRGVLAWDTTLGDVFSEDREPSRGLDPGWEGVTILQLLNHRGGCPADIDEDLWDELFRQRVAPQAARARLARETLERPPAQEPGVFVYSNTGYTIAGHAAELLTGTAWETLLEAELFIPLGMEAAGQGAPPAIHGHRPDGEPVPPGPLADNPPAIAPAGTVHASLGGWAAFARLHLDLLRGRPGDLVSPASARVLHTPPPGGTYAAGWVELERPWAGPSGRVMFHNGSNTMWHATAWLAPDRDLALLAVTNQGGEAGAAAVEAATVAMLRALEARERPPGAGGP